MWKYKKSVVSLFVMVLAVAFVFCLTAEFEKRHLPSKPFVKKEILTGDTHLRKYYSTQNPDLELWLMVNLPLKPACILVTAHGWHGRLGKPDKYTGKGDFVVVDVDMRGRAYSDGKPDLSGWELQDWIDAVEFVKKEYAPHISDPNCVYVEGGSGAGGNVYAILGKFPDYFSAAAIHAGMSDYELLYKKDEVGEFIDEMEGARWIGGSLESNPEGYKSRGGITTVQNLLTPVHIDHGETDVRVTVKQARQYVQKAQSLGKNVKYFEWTAVGDRQHWSEMTPGEHEALFFSVKDWFARHRQPPLLPHQGELVVAGYVKTKVFEVILDHIDRIGKVKYKLDKNGMPHQFTLVAPTSQTAKLRFRWSKSKELNAKVNGEIYKNVKKQPGSWVEMSVPVSESETAIAF